MWSCWVRVPLHLQLARYCHIVLQNVVPVHSLSECFMKEFLQDEWWETKAKKSFCFSYWYYQFSVFANRGWEKMVMLLLFSFPFLQWSDNAHILMFQHRYFSVYTFRMFLFFRHQVWNDIHVCLHIALFRFPLYLCMCVCIYIFTYILLYYIVSIKSRIVSGSSVRYHSTLVLDSSHLLQNMTVATLPFLHPHQPTNMLWFLLV